MMMMTTTTLRSFFKEQDVYVRRQIQHQYFSS